MIAIARLPDAPRWVVVAAVVAVLVGLTQVSLDEMERQPRLGIRTTGEVVTWVQPAGSAWDAGIRPGDVVRDFDGATIADARSLAAESPDGQVHDASVDSALGIATDRRPRSLVIGAAWTVLGCLVYLLAADRRAARVFLAWGMTGAVAAIAAMATPFGSAWSLAVVFVGVLGAGATLFLLSLTFPVNRLQERRGRWLAVASAAATLALAAAYPVVAEWTPGAYEWLQRAAFTLVSAELAGGAILLVLAFAHVPRDAGGARRAVGIIALGTAAAVSPFVFLTLLPRALGLEYVLLPDVSSAFIIVGQAAVAAAVLTREVLGISRMVSRGLVAVVVWTTLLVLYSLGFDLLRRAAPQLAGEPRANFGSILVAVAFVAGTFPIAQQHLRRRLERLLFRDVYSHADIMRELGSEIVWLTGADSVTDHVLDRIGATMEVEWTAIVLDDAVYRWGKPPQDVLAQASSGRAQRVPLVADGATIGTLLVGPKRTDVELSIEDRALLSTVAPLAATALQNALLLRRLEAQVVALGERERALEALNMRLMEVQEDERRRIALDLHDDPLQLAILLARHVNGEVSQETLRRLRQIAEEIIVSLRAICTGLHPPALDDFGLVAGLERLVSEIRGRSDLAASLAVEPDPDSFGRLDPNLEMSLYRVAQEALNNCLKHAEASHVAVSVTRTNGRVLLQVTDDGRGCNGAATSQGGDVHHLGILGMRERLQRWRGSLKVEPGADAGTVVSAEVEA